MGLHRWMAIGALLLGVGVALGAFGAHGLKSRVSPEMLTIWEKAVSYQMYHGYIFFILPLLARFQFLPDQFVSRVSAVFLFGVLIFSGSLYILVLSGVRWLGAITPLGGTALLAAWGMLVLKLLRQ